MVIASNVGNISRVRLFLKEFFEEAKLDQALFNKVYLGLSEAVTNSIVHGNQLNDSKDVRISVDYLDSKIILEIADEGEGFSTEVVFDPTTEENIKRESGRGIFLIRHFADEVTYMEGGRKILIKYRT